MNADLRVLISSSLLQMKQSFSRSMFKFCMVVYPLLYGFTLYMLYKDHDREQIISYVMLGSAVSSLWGTISFSSAGDINRERFMGALEIIFNAPSRFMIIMLGKVIGNTILGTASMIISIVFIVVSFGVPFTLADPFLFAIIFIIGILSFTAIAMLLSGLLTISRSTAVLMNCLDYPILILCGVAFPISVLPQWTIPFSYILSPTHFLILGRMCVKGISDYNLFSYHLLWLIGLTFLYTLLFLHFYKVIDIKARQHATLGVI